MKDLMNPIQQKHSIFSVASFISGVISVMLFVYLFQFLGFAEYLNTTDGNPENGQWFLILVFLLAGGMDFLTIGLGIIGLFQKTKKHTYSFLGFGTTFITCALFMVYEAFRG